MNEETEQLEKDEYSATLLILGDELEPKDLTEKLGIEPNQSWRKGELKFPDSDSVYETGGWKCFIPAEQEDLELEEQINWWCETLGGKASIMQLLEEKDFRLEMNCFATNAFQIPPDVLEQLSKLRLILTVFIY